MNETGVIATLVARVLSIALTSGMMMEHGEYIIYVDESGDHGLDKINADFPAFCLTFCVIRKTDYAEEIVPRFLDLKFRWFGHDMIILHESDVRKRNAPFVFLGDPEKRLRFLEDVGEIVRNAPITVIAGVIMKNRLLVRYENSLNPYSLALLFGMEHAHEFLLARRQDSKVTHIVAEARSPRRNSPHSGKEDRELRDEFDLIRAGLHPLQNGQPLSGFELIFADKKANSTGLQLADLLARPIALKMLRPDQPNRAYDLISNKLVLKTFP